MIVSDSTSVSGSTFEFDSKFVFELGSVSDSMSVFATEIGSGFVFQKKSATEREFESE